MPETSVTPPPAEGSIVLPSSTMKPGLSIRSILLIMLLLVSVASSVVVGLIGYVNGRESLQDAAVNSLVEVRDSRAREVTGLFDSITNTMLLTARGQSVANALSAFTDGFQELADAELTDEQRAELRDYFVTQFGVKLAEANQESVDASTFVPTGAAQSYLTLNYTV
ncbi:MAG: hypothetical protein Q8M65_05210, partial [Rhodoglobus sp.]|nr:hypothetical protein [Rhodoglobus sp.]